MKPKPFVESKAVARVELSHILSVRCRPTESLSKNGYPWLDAQTLVKRLYDTFGPHRLMWATDWPIAKERATYRQRLTVVRNEMTFLNADDKEWMLSKTVERVWPFP